jgi:hypothetical protein
MRLNDYKKLVNQFLNRRLTAEEFQKAYLTKFKQEKDGMDTKLFSILQGLFEDLDAYSPLWSEEDESSIRLTERNLRVAASEALKQLEAYQQG